MEKTNEAILPTGYLGMLMLMAAGYKLGKEESIINEYKHLVPKLKKYLNRTILPIDVAAELKNGKRKDLALSELPSNYPLYDVGKKTVDLYLKKIKSSETIFIKGLPGLCHTKAFTYGSEKILRAIASSRAFSVVGGGHTLTIIEKLKIPKKKFGYVSLSGGALLYYLSEGTLPGLEAIKHK